MKYICVDCKETFTGEEEAGEHGFKYSHFVSGEVMLVQPLLSEENQDD